MSPRADHRPAMSEPSAGSPLVRAGTRLLRLAVNAWLVFHVAAIIIAPAAVSPSSDLVQAGWSLFQPYLQILDLNHGYHFFAPEPEDSTLLAFEAERTDGTVVSGRIPDREIAPRLLVSPAFHADRANEGRAAALREGVGGLVRRASLSQVRSGSGQADGTDSPSSHDGDGSTGRAAG